MFKITYIGDGAKVHVPDLSSQRVSKGHTFETEDVEKAKRFNRSPDFSVEGLPEDDEVTEESTEAVVEEAATEEVAVEEATEEVEVEKAPVARKRTRKAAAKKTDEVAE